MRLFSNRKNRPVYVFLAIALLSSSIALLVLPGVAIFSAAAGPSTLPSVLVVSGPPSGTFGPDDITRLAVHGLDHDRGLIWTEYQNGVQPNGSASPTGINYSTIAAYDPNGTLIESVNVSGHVDGLTADHKTGMLIATSNEDDNSFLAVINPSTLAVTSYAYNPNPAVDNVGGTDSIAIRNGILYVSHSNPLNSSQATEYIATLDQATHTANLAPIFYDNSTATDALSGNQIQMNLTDPDSNYFMPRVSPLYGGDLATISQADGRLIFASNILNTPHLTQLNLTDNIPGNLPPIDGIAVATSGNGTLYVVDAKANTITALNTTGWPAGTVFVGEPSDNGNPLVGTLNLTTGVITPLGCKFVSPKGLLFVADPAPVASPVQHVSTTTHTHSTTHKNTTLQPTTTKDQSTTSTSTRHHSKDGHRTGH
jgi:hypothetical protein